MHADNDISNLPDRITRNHASTYQPNDFGSVSANLPQEDLNPPQEDLNPETLRRLKQAQYADELRQQIMQKQQTQKSMQNTQPISNQYYQSPPTQQKPQMNSFMTSLGSLYGDRTEELERKRKQQDSLAQSLLKQIEEKKEAQKLQRQKEELVDQYYSNHLPTYEPPSPELTPKQTPKPTPKQAPPSLEPVSYSTVNKQATQMLEELKSGRSFRSTNNKLLNQPPPPPAPVHQHPRITKIQPFRQTFNNLNDKNMSNTTFNKPPAPLLTLNSQQPQIVIPGPSQTQYFNIDVSTDSPFSRSAIKTPPLGFSLNRRANSTNKNPISLAMPIGTDSKQKKPQRYSSLAPTALLPDSTAPISILDEPILPKPNEFNMAATQPIKSEFIDQNINENQLDDKPNEIESNAQNFKNQVDNLLEDQPDDVNDYNLDNNGEFDLDEFNKAKAKQKRQNVFDELSDIKLKSISTLIYPDGHLSPISSPR